MNVLAIVNTSYQIIVVTQLRRKLFQAAQMDVIVTDQVAQGEEIAGRMQAAGLFDRVFFVHDKKELQSAAPAEKIWDILQFGLGGKTRFPVETLGLRERYDALLYYNLDLLAIRLFDVYVKKEPGLRLNRFEEGFLSYNSENTEGNNSRKAWILRLRRLFHPRKNWERYYGSYYCFFPELVPAQTKYTPEQIPVITAEDLAAVKTLNDIFGYEPDPREYDAKVIYFEGWFECGEKQIVEKLAEAAGRENIVVKPHPRHQTDWEGEVCVRTSVNNHVPWEIVQMNLDLSGSVLVAVSSSCPAVASALLRQDIPALYLFPCVKLQGTQNDRVMFEDVTRALRSALQRTQSKDFLPRVKIVENEAQLQLVLEKLGRNVL